MIVTDFAPKFKFFQIQYKTQTEQNKHSFISRLDFPL